MTEAAATAGVDGVWRTDHGTGPTVVLVHGTMDRSTSFGRVVRVLDEVHVVRYDRRGYGRSLALGPPLNFDQQIDDLLDVIGGDAPVVVVGHSYGGTIALGAAARGTAQIAGLVVYECPLPWMDWWPRRSAGASAVADSSSPPDAAEAFMRRMLGDERWQRLPPSTRTARRAEGETLVAEMGHLRPPFAAPFELGSIHVPVLAAHGSEGVAHHAQSIRAIADGVPDGRLVEVAGASHGVHLSHPADVAALVRTMVSRTLG